MGQVLLDETEVHLKDTPEPVQQAVKELVRSARLGPITKMVEAQDVTYDLDLKIGDKWETKTLANDGKLVP